jgi:hypothetical protein
MNKAADRNNRPDLDAVLFLRRHIRPGGCARRSYWQLKFAASSRLPLPEYFATFG